jgi:hypothetical protein
MRFRTLLSTLGRRATLGALAGALGLGAACNNDVDITDPNAPSSQTFFASATDAEAAVTATYNTLLRLGTGQRWWAFAHDMRSDVGTSTSPWAELQAFVKLQFPSGYDFEVNRELWNHSYELISRANLVTANVPNVQMNAADRTRLVSEAKFLRAMTYFNLISLYGGQIPLVLEPVTPTDRPASSDSATVFAQIEKDLTEAAAGMPRQLLSVSNGRATAGSAQGMLGKVQLQQRKWQQAATTLLPVVNGQYGAYDLVADYATLFRQEGNNSRESLFEVQMGNVDTCGQGLCGNNVSKMVGPCGPGYCDGLPTRWYFTQFFTDSTTTGRVDPRIDATLFYYKGDTTRVYNRTWRSWRDSTPGRRDEYRDTTRVFFKKYSEYYLASNDQNWEATINYKVLRFADVLLMYAEALNEQGQPAQAAPFVNRVRARVGLRPLSAALSQAQMRAAILAERAKELGLEGQRWRDLGRQNLFADLAGLRARDPDFNTFVAGKSQLLPIPTREINLNPNIRQNPNW